MCFRLDATLGFSYSDSSLVPGDVSQVHQDWKAQDMASLHTYRLLAGAETGDDEKMQNSDQCKCGNFVKIAKDLSHDTDVLCMTLQGQFLSKLGNIA